MDYFNKNHEVCISQEQIIKFHLGKKFKYSKFIYGTEINQHLTESTSRTVTTNAHGGNFCNVNVYILCSPTYIGA